MEYSATLKFSHSELELQDCYELLMSEDFDFQGKEIDVEILQPSNNKVVVEVSCLSLHHLKIATTAVINSFKIIEDTLNIVSER